MRILLSILLGTLFGMLCSNMANRKRKNPLLWFQIGFFFGILGPILFFLVLLKDKLFPNKKPIKQEISINTKQDKPIEPQQPLPLPAKTRLEDREWFYLDNGESRSISFENLKHLIQKKVIDETTFIWSEGMDKWKALKDLAYLKLILNIDNCKE